MAGGEVDFKRDLQELQQILWGCAPSNEIFERWAQGFVFSNTEATALEQRSGGPCAILAPVQAYMLKYIISSNKPDEFKKLTKVDQESLLIRAMVDILMQCTKRTQNPLVTLVHRDEDKSTEIKLPSTNNFELNSDGCSDTAPIASTSENPQLELNQQMVTSDIEILPLDLQDVPDLPDIISEKDNNIHIISFNYNLKGQQSSENESVGDNLSNEPLKEDCSFDLKNVPKPPNSPPEILQYNDETENLMIDESNESINKLNTNSKVPNLTKVLNDEILDTNIHQQCTLNSSEAPNIFHRSLRVVNLFTQDEVEAFFQQHIDQLQVEYGILLFLYSVLMTKGVQDLKTEIGDLSEPLIHEVYGYGSQSLVNLMLTGRAVQHVWDNDQDVGGLTLKGIDQQSDIGFVTLMEHMRYCTVGMFYKNPKYPIWILGSETHLTVAFSFDLRLVSPEQPWETARRIFRRYDPDGSNFIPFGLLQDLLQSLGLVSDPEYVEVMRQKLDSENLGIVLLSNFLDEFYPDMKSLVPETFTLWHYNGLAGSHHNNTVQYIKGHAVLLECDIKAGSEFDQVLTCLQTKWPNVEIQWETPNNKPPSLN